jgi:hypothetical protein
MTLTLEAKKLRLQADILRKLVPCLDRAADLCDDFEGSKKHQVARNGAAKAGKNGAPVSNWGRTKDLAFEILTEEASPLKWQALIKKMNARGGLVTKYDTLAKALGKDPRFTKPLRGHWGLVAARDGKPAARATAPAGKQRK